MTATERIEIPGLPAGLIAIGIRQPMNDDLVFVDGAVRKNYRYCGLIVQIADGFTLDYEAAYDTWTVVEFYPDPRKFLMEISVANSLQLKALEDVKWQLLQSKVSIKEI